MNFQDIKNKAKEAMGKHPDKTEQGIDKAGEYAKSRYGHDQQIDSATGKAKGYVGEDSTGNR
jgi:hypothetical protein